MCVGHITPNLCFLHPVESTGNVVQSGVPGLRNVDTLFFMLRWDMYGFHEKRDGTRYVELLILHPVHTSLCLKLFNSSCIATTQSGSRSSSSTLKGSKEETNE
jgi:hypothetical protein